MPPFSCFSPLVSTMHDRFDSGSRLHLTKNLEVVDSEGVKPTSAPLGEASNEAERHKSFMPNSPCRRVFSVPKARVGRPIQPPAVKALPNGRGGFRWRVTATIAGKQRRKFFSSEAEARTQASQWTGVMENAFFSVYTRIPPADMPKIELAVLFLRESGVSLSIFEAVKFAVANYKPVVERPVEEVVTQFETEKKAEGVTESQWSNVSRSTRRFFRHFAGPLASVTEADFRGFLAGQTGISEASAFNSLVADCRTFFRWAVKRKYLLADPTANIEKRKPKGKIPTTISPDEAEKFLRLVEREFPAWMAYAIFCLFAGLRPAIRDGEASRLHAALLARKPVFHAEGFDVDGKAHGVRLVPWSACGPLKAWLEAHPIPAGGGLWPKDLSPTKAEREWSRIRASCGLGQDVLRHTGISAMIYAPGASIAQVAIVAGNSEAVIRKRYLGRWSAEKIRRTGGMPSMKFELMICSSCLPVISSMCQAATAGDLGEIFSKIVFSAVCRSSSESSTPDAGAITTCSAIWPDHGFPRPLGAVL